MPPPTHGFGYDEKNQLGVVRLPGAVDEFPASPLHDVDVGDIRVVSGYDAEGHIASLSDRDVLQMSASVQSDVSDDAADCLSVHISDE